jgi:hypothetical protein
VTQPHPTFARFFDVLDRDHNGVIEAQDFARIGDALRVAVGDRSEAADGARAELWELLLLCLDADGSGTISREEFLAFERMLAEQTAEFGDDPPWLRAFFATLFAAIDVDDRGVITSAAYATLADVLGVPRDEADFAHLTGGDPTFALADLDARLRELFRATDPTARGLALLPGLTRSDR